MTVLWLKSKIDTGRNRLLEEESEDMYDNNELIIKYNKYVYDIITFFFM